MQRHSSAGRPGERGLTRDRDDHVRVVARRRSRLARPGARRARAQSAGERGVHGSPLAASKTQRPAKKKAPAGWSGLTEKGPRLARRGDLRAGRRRTRSRSSLSGVGRKSPEVSPDQAGGSGHTHTARAAAATIRELMEQRVASQVAADVREVKMLFWTRVAGIGAVLALAVGRSSASPSP